MGNFKIPYRVGSGKHDQTGPNIPVKTTDPPTNTDVKNSEYTTELSGLPSSNRLPLGDNYSSDNEFASNIDPEESLLDRKHDYSLIFGEPTENEDFLSDLPSLKAEKTSKKSVVKNHLKSSVSPISQFLALAKNFRHKIMYLLTTKILNYPKRVAILGLVLIVPLLLAIFNIASSDNQDRLASETGGQTLPARFIKEAQQDIYYPAQLPEGYKISVNESINDDTLAAYTITNDNVVITLSQQQNIPNEALQELFSGAESVDTDMGTAFIKRPPNGNLTGLLKINDTAVFLNTEKDIDNSILVEIFNYLKIAN